MAEHPISLTLVTTLVNEFLFSFLDFHFYFYFVLIFSRQRDEKSLEKDDFGH